MQEGIVERGASAGCWSGLAALLPALHAYVKRRCRGDVEVDDVVQETLLRAARYRHSLSDPARLRGWTMSIAENALRDHLQRELRLPRCESGEDELEGVIGREPAPGQDDEEDMLALGEVALPRAEALELLEQCLARLHQEDASVLRSYYSAPVLSCTRLAVQLHLRPEVLKMRVYRARRRLSGMLHGQLSTAGGA